MMKYAYFTVDDMRLGHDPRGISGWRLRQFLSLPDALAHYCALPLSGVKTIGMTDGRHILELMRCHPIFPDDAEGENVLTTDHRTSPLWRDIPESAAASAACLTQCGPRYQLEDGQLVPIPKGPGLPDELRDKYLWLDLQRDPESAIRGVYVAGKGWLPSSALKRKSHGSHYPLILKYRADVLTAQGDYSPLEVEPWVYKLLLSRTLARLEQNKQMKEEGGTPT